MIYLALEIVLWLLAAALIGFLGGWLVRGALRKGTDQAAGEMAMAARLTAAEADFEARNFAAEAALARVKAELHAATTRADTIEGEAKRRFTEMETGLKQQALTAEARAADSNHALEKARNMFATADREWSHRAGASDSRAADAERRAGEAEARLTALAAELDAVRNAGAPDSEREAQLSALSAERDALASERDLLREQLAAAEARPAPAPRKPRAKPAPAADGDPAAPAKAPVRRRRVASPPEEGGGEA